MEEPFAFDQDDEGATAGQSGPHQRTEPRDSMFLSATIRHLGTGESWSLRVRNISAGGLMADCSGLFRRGDKVELELRGVGLQQATVAWTAQNRIGIAFDKPINPILTRKPVASTRAPAAPAPVDMKRPWLKSV